MRNEMALKGGGWDMKSVSVIKFGKRDNWENLDCPPQLSLFRH